MVIGTAAGPKHLQLMSQSGLRYTFRADMGAPTNVREEVLNVNGVKIRAVVLGVGNPQCVVLGPVTEERLHNIAAALAVHPFFPAVRTSNWPRSRHPTECAS